MSSDGRTSDDPERIERAGSIIDEGSDLVSSPGVRTFRDPESTAVRGCQIDGLTITNVWREWFIGQDSYAKDQDIQLRAASDQRIATVQELSGIAEGTDILCHNWGGPAEGSNR